MGKKNKKQKFQIDSISLGKSIKVTSVTNYKDFTWFYILQLFLVWLGIYTPIICFASSFDLSYMKDVIILASIATTVFYWFIFYFYQYLKYSIPITAVVIIYLIIKYKAYLLNGFYHLENAIIDKLNYYFNMSVVKYKTELSKVLCLTLLLIVIMQLLGILLSLLIVREKRKSVYIFVSLLFVLSGFFVGVIPNPYALVMYILFVYTIFAMDIRAFRKKIEPKRHETSIKDTKVEYKQIVRLKVGAVVGGILGIITIVILILFSPKTYSKYVDFTETKINIQSTLMNFSFEDFVNDVSKKFEQLNLFNNEGAFKGTGTMGGGLSGGKLSATPKVEFTNKTVFKLTMPAESGSLYLKGFAGATYTGTSWEDLNRDAEKKYRSIVETYGGGAFTGENLSNEYLNLFLNGVISFSTNKLEGADANPFGLLKRFTLDIDYVNANENFMYAPYFLGELPTGDFLSISDLYAKPMRNKSFYNYSYYKLTMVDTLADNLYKFKNLQDYISIQDDYRYSQFLEFEENYRKFVYETYVGIPVDKFQRLTKIELGVPKAYDTDSMIRVVNMVTSYLSNTTSYTLSPGALPKGQDYIEYFLFDSRRGYCAHYASAAVMLLRYYGVPARYVEGYIVTENDINHGRAGDITSYQMYDNNGNERLYQTRNRTVEIHDTNAHAWVEVYMDGVGWLPIEVTAGYSMNGINSINNTIQNEVSNIPSPTPLPTNTPKPTEKPEVTATNAPTPTTGINPTESEVSPNPSITGGANSGEYDKFGTSILKDIIFILCMVLLLLSLCWLRYLVLRYFREKNSYDAFHRNESALYLYSQIEKMLKILKFQKMESETYEQFFERLKDEYESLPEGYEKVLALLLKARFSNQRITKEEFEEILSYFIEFRESFYKQFKKIRQFYIKYWNIL